MKQTIMALIVITLFSCKKTPSRVVTENPTPEPTPCNVAFYSKTPNNYLYLTIEGKKYETTEVETSPSCEQGFIYKSYVGRVINYSYEGIINGKGTVTLNGGCNAIELK